MKNLREQYNAQTKQAIFLSGFFSKPVDLYLIKFPEMDARISIIGHTISYGALDVWKQCGAKVKFVKRITTQ